MKEALYQQIADQVRRDIAQNSFGGRQMPNESVLLERYKVSKVTLHRAMQVLAREGTINRIHGKGSFIRDRNHEMTMARQVGVLMGVRGHFHTPLYDAVIGRTIDAGYYCVTMGYQPQLRDAEQPEDRLERLHGLLASPIRGIIANGQGYRHYPFMRDYDGVRAVFMLSFDSDDKMPGKGVFCDYQAAVTLATEHLLRLGHRRIALLTYLSRETANPSPGDRLTNHADYQLAEGYRKCLRSCQEAAAPQVLYYDAPGQLPGESFVGDFRRLLQSADRPTALVCTADVYAIRAMGIVAELGLRVPEDIAIVGMYNTPWCLEAPVPITSVDFQPELIGQTAVDMLLDDDDTYPRVVTIPPKLKVRRSCGNTH